MHAVSLEVHIALGREIALAPPQSSSDQTCFSRPNVAADNPLTQSNAGNANGGITVNGGTGTTTVSVKQTETAAGNDGVVKIADANGTSTTAAGTITTVTLDGLSHSTTATFTSPGAGLVVTGTILNTITDNALTTLTINNVDAKGAARRRGRRLRRR